MAAKPARKALETDFAALLRSAGLRRTGPRVAVLEQLHRAQAPVSHGELAESLVKAGFDRATIYRNLVDLADVGLVARTDLGDHVWRFELRGEGGVHAKQHPHLVCTECGEISCLTDVQVQVRAVRGKRSFNTAEMEVQLKGRCERCAA
jgi:Fur family ferric uptake transcriptional regulator